MSSVKENVSVNVQVDAQVSNEISFAILNKGLREASKLAKSLNQTLRAFDGILGDTVSVTLPKGGERTFTIGELFNFCGVKVSANKKGKVSLSAFRAGVKALWNEQGAICVYRNVPAHVFTEGEQGQNTRVYTFDSEHNVFKTVNKLMLCEVAEGKWNVDLVLRVMLQAKYVSKYEKRAKDSEEAWANVKTIYTFEKRVNKGGETNKARSAKKELVIFGQK